MPEGNREIQVYYYYIFTVGVIINFYGDITLWYDKSLFLDLKERDIESRNKTDYTKLNASFLVIHIEKIRKTTFL